VREQCKMYSIKRSRAGSERMSSERPPVLSHSAVMGYELRLSAADGAEAAAKAEA
jgi:hypothetical protein